MAGSLYLLVSLASNSLVQASPIFYVPYSASCVLGLYAGYVLYTGKTGRGVKFASLAAIALGLASTFLLFLLGLRLKGVVGPAWVLFLVSAWVLWRARGSM